MNVGEIVIPDDELEWTFARSGGPGGQNVNKVASKAQLRWRPSASTALGAEVMERLLAQQKSRLTSDGDLLISSQVYRDQERNRQACLDKLAAMIEKALHPPPKRRPTRPGRAARENRLEGKRRRAEIKSARRSPGME
jgi:ribosome-associated protein